jgi:hypothetical protein
LRYLTPPEKLTDQTVRRHWQDATKVNIRGERVSIDPEGPLAQAQWAKTRYGIATQTLPNGYGGQARMVEMNQQVLTNLDRMIGEVEKTVTEDVETTRAS